MDTTTLGYLLIGLIVLVVLGAMFFPDRFRVVLKFLGFHAEVEGGRALGDSHGSTDGGGGNAPAIQQVPGGTTYEAKAVNSGGAQVVAGDGNDVSSGTRLPDRTGATPASDVAPDASMRATAEDAPGAQVVSGIGNRVHRDDSVPTDGEARGKAQ